MKILTLLYRNICKGGWGMLIKKRKYTKPKRSIYRRIDMMTCCYKKETDTGNSRLEYIFIDNVKSHSDVKLSKSYGNINFADFWLETVKDNWGERNGDSGNELHFKRYISLLSDEKTEDQQQDFGTSFLKENVLFIEICLNAANHQTELAAELQELINKTGRVFYTLGNADLIIALAHDKSSGEEQIIQKIFEIVHRDYVHSCNVLFGKRKDINDEGRIRISTDLEYTDDQESIKNRFKIKNLGQQNPVQELQEIEKYLMNNMQEYSNNRNKKMLAFSQSLLRIIHIMRQQFKKGNHKNIFYIFYPQVVLFVRLFGEGKELLETEEEQHLSNLDIIDKLPYEERQVRYEAEVSLYNGKKYQIIGEIEQAFRDFIDITEILLHQIGHSSESVFEDKSQDLFLDDIPIKLCFLYIAYMHEVTYLLNDNPKNEYQYCLSPLAYSVPETECFEFGLLPKSRLIKVMISRHMMFTPRSLFIILSHEVSHYVNDQIRSRVFRSSCMEKILGIVFTEIFYNIDISENVPEDVKKYYRWSKKNTKEFINKKIDALMKEKKNASNLGAVWHHFRYYYKDLIRTEKEIWYDKDWELENNINELPHEIASAVREKPEMYSIMEEIRKVQQEVQTQVDSMMAGADDEVQKFLESMKRIMKEVVADMSGIMLLENSVYDYLEAFVTSEGEVPNKDTITVELINRIAMVVTVLTENDYKSWRKDCDNLKIVLDEDCKNGNNWEASVYLKDLWDKVKLFSGQIALMMKRPDEEPKGKRQCNTEEKFQADDFFGNLGIIKAEKEYFQKCYENTDDYLKQIERSQEKKRRREQILTLYQDFAAKEKGKDNSINLFFESYNKVVNEYIKHIVNGLK